MRAILGTATLASLAIGFMSSEPRWFAASGAFGLMWWAWDLLVEHVFQPLGAWMFGIFTEGVGVETSHENRLTLDDTIRLLEGHIERGASRRVEINSAIRLEEIYRTVKKDPEAARRVIERVKQRYPDAAKLRRYEYEEY